MKLLSNASLPLVSVIVPVYNTEAYLSRCIDSIVSQSYVNLEIILIDDGSTDNSGIICDHYASQDSRIIVYHQQNSGAGTSRQYGLNHSSGDLVVFVDSDDWIASNMIELLYNAMVNGGADISVCQFKYVRGDNLIEEYTINSEILGIKNSIEFAHFLYDGGYSNGVVCSLWNKLYKKELFKGINIRNARGEDEEVNDIINSKGVVVNIIQDCLYFYNSENDSSITHRSFSESNFQFLEVLNNRVQLFDNDAYMKSESIKLYINLYIEYYYRANQSGILIPALATEKFNDYYLEYRRLNRFYDKLSMRVLLFNMSPFLYTKLIKLI